MEEPHHNRLRAVLLLTVAVVFLFMAITGGYAWWIMRPVPGTLAVAILSPDGLLLTGRARMPVMPLQEMDLVPSPMRAAARAHRFNTRWSLVAPGKKQGEADLSMSFEDARAVPPVACGEDILSASLPDRVILQSRSGAKHNEYSIKQCTVRSLAASPDGQWAAFACSRAPMLKTQGRQPGLDPYERESAPWQTEQTGAYRLFLSGCDLNNVREVDVSKLYPALGPGALAWGADSGLYFTGYIQDNHAMRATYRMDPLSGAINPVPGSADWGQAFALAPDGETAASVDGFNLTFTDTRTGEQTRIAAGPPIEIVLPSWSPDARRVAMVMVPRIQGEQGANPATSATGLKVIVADPAKRAFKTKSEPVRNFNCGLCRPYWSPDGKRVFVNGSIFEERRAGFFVNRNAVLCMDTASGSVSFPQDPASLWK